MLVNKKFILASTSKSRHQILSSVGLNFRRVPPQCDEETLKQKLIKEKKTPQKIVFELAKLKALSVSALYSKEIIVGSDTIVEYKGKLLGKAKTLKEAKKKILYLSGKKHNIFTSVYVCFDRINMWSSTKKTKVTIRKLNKREIDSYVLIAGKEILSAVGCFQIEKYGPLIIEDIEGDFFNVMGFPFFLF